MELACFEFDHYSESVDTYGNTENDNKYLLSTCRNLARVSVKGATLYIIYNRPTIPLPQEILIKFVRRHPTLRWLRSDLTAENVEMLRQERPEMTFVSD